MVDKNFRHILRIAETDLKGERPVFIALKRIKGIGFSMSNAICNTLNLPKNKKIGNLTDSEVKDIESTIKNPSKLPSWLYNRRKDYDTGEDIHITSSKLKFQKELDIKKLKKIKSYRGMRHQAGLPLRGQRTKYHFRKGHAIGVQRKKMKQQSKSKKAPAKGKKK